MRLQIKKEKGFAPKFTVPWGSMAEAICATSYKSRLFCYSAYFAMSVTQIRFRTVEYFIHAPVITPVVPALKTYSTWGPLEVSAAFKWLLDPGGGIIFVTAARRFQNFITAATWPFRNLNSPKFNGCLWRLFFSGRGRW
jgi:hypothetical protein